MLSLCIALPHRQQRFVHCTGTPPTENAKSFKTLNTKRLAAALLPLAAALPCLGISTRAWLLQQRTQFGCQQPQANKQDCARAHAHTRTHARTRAQKQKHAHADARAHTSANALNHAHARARTHTHTRTHAHTHTHTHAWPYARKITRTPAHTHARSCASTCTKARNLLQSTPYIPSARQACGVLDLSMPNCTARRRMSEPTARKQSSLSRQKPALAHELTNLLKKQHKDNISNQKHAQP